MLPIFFFPFPFKQGEMLPVFLEKCFLTIQLTKAKFGPFDLH